MTKSLAYVAVDCAADQMRVWQMDAAGNVLKAHQVAHDPEPLSAQAFEGNLLQLLKEDVPHAGALPVICTGPTGLDVRFEIAPCKAPDASKMERMNVSDKRLAVWCVPGVAQRDPDDMMHLEAVQLAGFLAKYPKFDGVVCLPGAQSKWVRVSAEEIVSFQTFLTGQLVDMLAQHSVVRAAVDTADVDKSAFLNSVSEAISRPQSVAAKLYGLHAGHQLSKQSLTQGKSSLLGMMIGTELAGSRPYWLGMDIAIIGTSQDCALYSEALSAQGCLPKVYEGDAMTLAGMQLLFAGL